MDVNRGIYIIKNLKKNKFYIGSSNSIELRIYEHFHKLGYNEHYNYRMQKDYLQDFRYFVWAIYKTYSFDTNRSIIYEEEQELLDRIINKYNILMGSKDHLTYNEGVITKERQLKINFGWQKKN